MKGRLLLIVGGPLLLLAAVVAPVLGQTGETHQVDTVDNEFVPDDITITVGDTVRWVAAEANEENHTLHEDSSSLFDTDLAPGEEFTFTFTQPGTYTYHCDIHPPDMDGVIRVEQPLTVPGPPRNVTATAGDGAATVSWQAPSSNGGSTITAYTVTTLPDGPVVEVAGAERSAVVEGLENGSTYTFTVTATNAQGTGEPSVPSNAVTPTDEPDPSPSPSPSPSPDPDPDCAAADFTDRAVIPDTHRTNVDCAAERGIVTGFADGSYGPTAQVRRDQMASFIARALEAAGVALPAPQAERFTDVDAGSPHDENIHRLAAAGIVEGGAGGLPTSSYGPSQGVRRDQMASFLVRAAAFATQQDLASQSQRFTDVGPGNPHFANVNGASEVGLAQGFADGTYGPGQGVRRDQMGTFVMRLVSFLDDPGG